MVMIGPGAYMSTSGGGGTNLVKEVGKEIEGDLRIDTIERILALSDPGYGDEYNPSLRDPYESLVLDTWIEVLGADEALQRCRGICEEVSDTSKGLRRNAARTAAYLLARAGEHEQALKALEVAICKLEAPAGTPRWYQTWYDNAGTLSHKDIRRLFPKDDSGFADPVAWMQRAADQLVTWTKEERTRPGATFQALAVATLRLHEAGEEVAALSLLKELEALAKDNVRDRLWVVDVAREIGAEDTAYGIEKTLLEDRQLNLERLGEVVRRMATRDGADAALAAGESAAEITLDEDLLAALAAVATEAGKVDRAVHWEAVADEAAEAREALKPKKESE